jgi:hypothetical protein
MFDTNHEEFAPLNIRRLTTTGAVSTMKRARRWAAWIKPALVLTLVSSPLLYMLGRYLVQWKWGV